MNIFILDLDVDKCAEYHCDKHIVKMIIETAQILSTALHSLGVPHNGYKPTHSNHPCCVWARDLNNWLYLRQLGFALGREYERRYGRVHKSIGVISSLPIPLEMTVAPPKRFALAMPVTYHQYKKVRGAFEIDPVASYRAYYQSKQQSFSMTWKTREVPVWFKLYSEDE